MVAQIVEGDQLLKQLFELLVQASTSSLNSYSIVPTFQKDALKQLLITRVSDFYKAEDLAKCLN